MLIGQDHGSDRYHRLALHPWLEGKSTPFTTLLNPLQRRLMKLQPEAE